MEKEGWKILLIGDMNIAPQRIDAYPNLRTNPHQHILNRADFNSRFLDAGKMDGFGGVDIWRYIKGEEKKYTYYPRDMVWGTNCDRVDLAIASRTMVEDGDVVGAEIWDTEEERGSSDHVPISVEIRWTK